MTLARAELLCLLVLESVEKLALALPGCVRCKSPVRHEPYGQSHARMSAPADAAVPARDLAVTHRGRGAYHWFLNNEHWSFLPFTL